jgi:Neocarzinostatin family
VGVSQGLAAALVVGFSSLVAPQGTASAGAPGDAIEVTAEPSAGLVDFQIIQVTGVGFRPFSLQEIFECRADAVDESGCDPDNAYDEEADADGVVHFSFPVDARIFDETGREFDCRSTPNGCKIGIGRLGGFSQSGFVLLDFDPAAPLHAVPTAAVEPATGLRDRQTVTVRGANLVGLFETFVYQCAAGRPRSGDSCNFDQDIRGVAGDDGLLTVDYRVDSTLRPTAGGEPIDCTVSPGACVIELSQGFSASPDRFARTPIAFAAPAEPPPTTPPTAPSPPPAPPAMPVAAHPTFTG